MQPKPTPEELAQFRIAAQAMHLIKKQDGQTLIPIRIAYHPYLSSLAYYQQTANISKVWQKLVSLVSQQPTLIESAVATIAQSDPLIKGLLGLFKIRRDIVPEQQIILNRCDFFRNTNYEPKIIEYNLSAVSMTAHTQNITEAKRLTHWEMRDHYMYNRPHDKLIGHIAKMFKKGGLKGITLLVLHSNETNMIEIGQVASGLLQDGIKTRFVTLLDIADRGKVNEDGSLQFEDDLVSFVYFRTGYRWQDYQPETEKRWGARRLVEESNAIRMPSISMELINQKRLQVEISKPQVYKKYLTEEETKVLEQSLVKLIEFDHLSQEQFEKLYEDLKANPNKFILKPNAEGGGNNFYGEDVITKLGAINAEERKNYILMEKIETDSVENLLLEGDKTVECECQAEMSHYSVVRAEKGQIVENEVIGHLVRIKPTASNEAGIMSGAGSLSAWLTN